MATDKRGMFFRWAWGTYHALGLIAWWTWGADGFRVYLWGFLGLEVVGVLAGRPMTRSVRGVVRDTWDHPVWGAVVAGTVAAWAYAFAVGATLLGPFVPPINAFLVMLLFGIWLIPHFFGNRWG